MGKVPRWECEFCGRSLRTEEGSLDMIYTAMMALVTAMAVVTMAFALLFRYSVIPLFW